MKHLILALFTFSFSLCALSSATIAEKLSAVADCKADIKAAIEAKGVTVGDAPLADYAAKILAIPTGGGSVGPWFRWTYVAKYTAQGSLDITQVALSRLALYDADDTCVNLDLVAGSSATALAPGQFWQTSGQADAKNVFNTGRTDASTDKWIHNGPDLPQTWVMRLPSDSAATVVKYNLAIAGASAGTISLLGRYPSSWTLETSTDGTDWRVIDSQSDVTPPSVTGGWYAGGGAAVTPTAFYWF